MNQEIIIYQTDDGKSSMSLIAKDGDVWMNQNQIAELFDTSKQNVSQHIMTILKHNELIENSVVNNYFTTASDDQKLNNKQLLKKNYKFNWKSMRKSAFSAAINKKLKCQ